MKKIKQLYLNSMKELASAKAIAFLGIMAALAVILGFVASIDLGPYVRIGFSGLPNRIVEATFGPFVGCLFGGALDVIKFIVKPTGTFFPGFTFDAMLAGILYGSILYRKEISVPRIFMAELVNKVIVNCGFNTLWISVLYGKGFLALLPARIIKNAIMLPIDTMLVFVCLGVVARVTHKFTVVPIRKKQTVVS